MPRLIIPSLQVNMRAGELPPPDEDGKRYLKVPVNTALTAQPRGFATSGAVRIFFPEEQDMERKQLTDMLSIGPQIQPDDVATLKDDGFRAIICNRPDGEGADQPSHEEMARAAEAAGLEFRYLPVTPGIVTDETAEAFGTALGELPGPVFAYCRTGTRSATLWSLSEANRRALPEILGRTKAAGYDMNGVARRIANGGRTPTDTGDARYDVVIVGAGAAGISVASSLKARKPDLDIALIDPADIHYYQPRDAVGLGPECRDFGGQTLDRLRDERGGLRGLIRESIDRVGDDGKALARLAGTGCFDVSVDGQNVHLARDVQDGAVGLAGAFGCAVDPRQLVLKPVHPVEHRVAGLHHGLKLACRGSRRFGHAAERLCETLCRGDHGLACLGHRLRRALGLLQCAGLLTRGGIHAVKETRHIHDVARHGRRIGQGVGGRLSPGRVGCSGAGRLLVHVFTSGDRASA